MTSWTERMRWSLVTSCGHPHSYPYPHRLDKVKFGISLDEVCKNDIPGPLLVLILKLNKEAPLRKDVFRAPGHQGAMKKLIHFLQCGRLVNVDNYSVYTIASVLKKFLRKIPGGIFGRDGEIELFQIVEIIDETEQQKRINRLILSLPIYTQRILVLLFGTFRVIASNSERAGTGMSSEALGVSVAPSFFQSCVSDGKTARMEDVLRFKVATRIMKQIIDQFAVYDLFGRENYEFYARVTGRILRVQDEWICSFRYPPPPRGKTAQQTYALQFSLEAEKTWLQCECDRWGLLQEESQSTPALLSAADVVVGNSSISLGIIPEHSLLESCARLSVSLEGPTLFTVQTQSKSSSSTKSSSHSNSQHMTMDELRAVNRYAESTKSLSYLPQVHERQTARMRTRSEWFLGACNDSVELNTNLTLRSSNGAETGLISTGIGTYHSHDDLAQYLSNNSLSVSAESVQQIRKLSKRGSTSRHRPHRSSSRRNKENDSRSGSFRKPKISNNSSNNSNNFSIGELGKMCKQRTVSFDQPSVMTNLSPLPCTNIPSTVNHKWCEYVINIDGDIPEQCSTNQQEFNSIISSDEVMDMTPLIIPNLDQHFKLPKT